MPDGDHLRPRGDRTVAYQVRRDEALPLPLTEMGRIGNECKYLLRPTRDLDAFNNRGHAASSVAVHRNDYTGWNDARADTAVLLQPVVGFGLAGNLGTTDEEILAHFADGGHRTADIASFFLAPVAILFFLLFLSTLWNRLRSVEAEPRTLSTLALAAGVTSAALFVAAVAVLVSTALAARDSEFVVDPSLARLVDKAGYLLITGSVMVMSALVAATSVLALRTRFLPSWLGWTGLFVAVVLLAAITFVPIFVLWLWILIVSVMLVARPPTTHPTSQDVAAPH